MGQRDRRRAGGRDAGAATCQGAPPGAGRLRFCQADAHALPFHDAAFDAITCRLALPCFSEARLALRECRRVPRPGGRLALLVWDATAVSTLLSAPHLLGARAGAGSGPPLPNVLRFARAGAISRLLREAGFGAVAEQERVAPFPWPGTPEESWEGACAMQPVVSRLFAGVPAAGRAGVRRRMLAVIRPRYDGRQVNFTAAVILATGRRQAGVFRGSQRSC